MTNTTQGQSVLSIDGRCTLPPAAIGQKAWGVNRMRRLGLRVPPAMVITTAACEDYFRAGNAFPAGLWEAVTTHVRRLEIEAGRCFGGGPEPLLLSVRSGAPQSMPGMMDTVLNLGMNDSVAGLLAQRDGAQWHAEDTLARFRRQYARVVLRAETGIIPEDPWQQLQGAISAVFDSWHSPRAKAYRAHHGMSDNGGTGVLIQVMVFGNRDARSGTGVMFSRSPITGSPPAWGEWLAGGQGEDVVAGERTPQGLDSLRMAMPEVHDELLGSAQRIEDDAGDIQDIEFTVESGTLWLLQCRAAKRSAHAALRAAVAFAEAGRISTEEALRRISSRPIATRQRVALAAEASLQAPLLIGTPASPGIASGLIEGDPGLAQVRALAGEAIVLARPTTSPDDIHGVLSARGLLTEQGGATSHAAVVSRELGCPCVVACGQGSLGTLQGRRVTLDGATGRVWVGDLTVPAAAMPADPAERKLLDWGGALLRMSFLSPAQAPADVVDLEAWGDAWRMHLRPGLAVRGRVLDTEEGIRAALAAGVKAVVTQDAMTALLVCLRQRFGASGAAATPVTPPASDDSDRDVVLLQLLALKGAGVLPVLCEALDREEAAVREAYAPLAARGLCVTVRDTLQLTSAGRTQLEELLAQERQGVNRQAMGLLLEEFRVANAELKAIVTAWQLRSGARNDHTDPTYDAGVLQRLRALHAQVEPLLNRLVEASSRMRGYAERLRRARVRIEEGDVASLSKVTGDSYHMVWHELHREMITLAGMDYAAEAAAGNAG